MIETLPPHQIGTRPQPLPQDFQPAVGSAVHLFVGVHLAQKQKNILARNAKAPHKATAIRTGSWRRGIQQLCLGSKFLLNTIHTKKILKNPLLSGASLSVLLFSLCLIASCPKLTLHDEVLCANNCPPASHRHPRTPTVRLTHPTIASFVGLRI